MFLYSFDLYGARQYKCKQLFLKNLLKKMGVTQPLNMYKGIAMYNRLM